ncbi:MAG: hypothetical protein EKK53_09875 [Burkholderiales bacterium]|nr:MAG: hypothetical protein EKK53_09875 [Burkholderiales bacterium]
MKRHVKLIATGTLLGTQALPGYVSVAGAQNASLPPVSVTGSSSGGYNGSGLGFYASSYSGGGSLSGGPPEAEASSRTPAPPPAKSPQEIADNLRRDKERRCEEAKARDTKIEETRYQSALNNCVAKANSSFGITILNIGATAPAWILNSDMYKNCETRETAAHKANLSRVGENDSACRP